MELNSSEKSKRGADIEVLGVIASVCLLVALLFSGSITYLSYMDDPYFTLYDSAVKYVEPFFYLEEITSRPWPGDSDGSAEDEISIYEDLIILFSGQEFQDYEHFSDWWSNHPEVDNLVGLCVIFPANFIAYALILLPASLIVWKAV